MVTIILILHIILAVGIIGLVLLQRSEGGGLGIGGSQSGGFMTARGTANALTKLTTFFGAMFFITSIFIFNYPFCSFFFRNSSSKVATESSG